ncbi:hypothetical protein [Dyella sp.]|uniref:hypothetical protein n=1 Tax=Dyella sp. TaxID=1869338 RepID=UPI002ED12612
MSDNSSPQGSDGGVASHHPAPTALTPKVATTTANDANRIVTALKPIACLRVDDVRFEFASSFIRPGVQEEMRLLEALMKQHDGATMSLFGHADPVGDDANNKTLSGRRVIAVYAALTRQPSLWDKLYSSPANNDRWGDPSLRAMLNAVDGAGSGDPKSGPDHSDPVAPYRNDTSKRQQLYKRYMDKLCGSLLLQKTDFLARGADADGKGDYQGCGEFNPLVVLSTQYDSGEKAVRDAANAPNRRVLMLLFEKGTVVDTSRWPCPRASEGASGCHARFWSDGERRRSTRLANESRSYGKTQDTFACRFYDRLVTASPCEKPPEPLVFRFVEEFTKRPIAGAQVVIRGPSGNTQTYTADEHGNVLVMGHPGTVFSVVHITTPETDAVSHVEHTPLQSNAQP